MRPSKSLNRRIKNLKSHLQQESPLLVDAVGHFQKLDKIGYQTGLLQPTDSFANQISWWPLVSVLGTFSAGKSSFINSWLGIKLQNSGNQAVDDKFTVITFSGDDEVRVLPGLALDADPRFPFYQISDEIEKVTDGDGSKIDSYLQLKTCHVERLKGKILIDSPGFDADEQRNAILKISSHIIDLSDLVIVFFDARHPEPGAMHDTLEHLVRTTIQRNDANKFIFVLNQIDTTANDDNLEEVVAAWQKAIAQTGMTAGTFYCIYNDDLAVEISTESVKERYQVRRNRDMLEIERRIDSVGVERIYRIMGDLENTADLIEQKWIPKIGETILNFRRRVLLTDSIVFGLIAMILIGVGAVFGGITELWSNLVNSPVGIAVLAVGIAGLVWAHFKIRNWHAKDLIKRLSKAGEPSSVINGFARNSHFTRSIWFKKPLGWGKMTRNKLAKIRDAADVFIQTLNDSFTDPSGKGG